MEQPDATPPVDIEPEVRRLFNIEARRLGSVPLLPQAAREVMALLNDPTTSVEKITQCIRRDPSLATNLLRTANSATYLGATAITTIPAALVRLGTTGIHRLLMSAAAARVLNVRTNRELAARLQARAVAVSNGAARIAKHFGTDPEAAFLGGLLHDVGWAIAYASAPNVLLRLPLIYRQKPELIDPYIERMHAQLGSVVAEGWKLPTSAVDAIRAHHSPVLLAGGLIAHIVYAAGRVADLGEVFPSSDPAPPPDQDSTLLRLRIDAPMMERLLAGLKLDMAQR